MNEIVSGEMTNNKWGEYKVRHEIYAYSRIKIEPTEEGKVHMTIYNFEEKRWVENP